MSNNWNRNNNMELKKENIYISLKGKSNEDRIEILNYLKSIKEKTEEYIHNEIYRQNTLEFFDNEWLTDKSVWGKTEVTFEQLKEILQPMSNFRPIAMRCTKEQFDAIKPKLTNLLRSITGFTKYTYLTNNLNGKNYDVSNTHECNKREYNREVYEEWNEEIFLKACGIEVETLQEKEQRLLKELEEVRKEIEDSKIKVGDWCKFWDGDEDKFLISKLQENIYNSYLASNKHFLNCEKITDSALLLSLNKLFKN